MMVADLKPVSAPANPKAPSPSQANPRKLRVGISTSVVQRGKTGIAQYVFALVRALLDAGRNEYVLFVLEEDLGLFDFARPKAKIVVVPERHRPATKNILWHQTVLPGLAREQQLDVIHIPSYRRLLWSKACPTVGTIHDLAPFHVAGKYDWKRMLYGKYVSRVLAGRQNQIIAISHNTAQDISTFFKLPGEKVTVVHNGIDHARFAPGGGPETRKAVATRFKLEKPFFLYVARLEHPAKNHVRLIQAFEQFKTSTGSDWELVFGGSDWNRAEEIHSAIRHSSFQPAIRTLGFVGDEVLPDLYRAAGAFVYPSLYEGFGFPPLEAMACGCPVISSRCGSLGEVVGDAALIVDPTDIAAISQALATVSLDDKVRSRLIAAGFAQAALFNWQRAAQQTEQVYLRAVEVAGRC
jgi:glycosyltransferase involved in cell wall biosynthesis